VSVRAIRWMLFGAGVLALPVPMVGPFPVVVPPARYAILLGAAGAVAWTEGVAGPVSLILGLLALNVLLSLAAAGLAGWIVSGVLGRLPSPVWRAGIAVGLVVASLAWAALVPLYTTGFGRSPSASLLGLWP